MTPHAREPSLEFIYLAAYERVARNTIPDGLEQTIALEAGKPGGVTRVRLAYHP